MKKPISLVILAWLLIGSGLWNLSRFYELVINVSMSDYRLMPIGWWTYWPTLRAPFIIAIGIAILQGRIWSRVAFLIVAIINTGIILSIEIVPGVTAGTAILGTLAIALLEPSLCLYLLYRRPATRYFHWMQQQRTSGSLKASSDGRGESSISDVSEAGDSTQATGKQQNLINSRVRNALVVALLVLAGCALCGAQSLLSTGLSEWVQQRGMSQDLNPIGREILSVAYKLPFVFSGKLIILSAFFLGMGAWISAFRSRARNVGLMLIASAAVGVVLVMVFGDLNGLLRPPTSADAPLASPSGQALSNVLLWLGGSMIWPVLLALVGAWLVRRGRAIAAAPVQSV